MTRQDMAAALDALTLNDPRTGLPVATVAELVSPLIVEVSSLRASVDELSERIG